MNERNLLCLTSFESRLSAIEDEIESVSVKESVNLAVDYSSTLSSESNLDGWDAVVCIASAAASVLLSTNEKFEKWLADIHEAANGQSGQYDFVQTCLGKLFEHQGDDMDMFSTRSDDSPWRQFHRLFFGHDPFSWSLSPETKVNDNPFFLMFSQRRKEGHSGLLGIVQASRHLLADTFSQQGLPFPGSSHLDYIRDDGKPWNYLIDLVQELSKEAYGVKTKAEPIYEHLLTIRAQDVAGGMAALAITEAYLRLRHIEDDIRKAQIKLVAYSMSFFSQVAYGAYKQGGIPYINAPLGLAMAKAFVDLLHSSNQRTRMLEKESDMLQVRVDSALDRRSRIHALVSGGLEGNFVLEENDGQR